MMTLFVEPVPSVSYLQYSFTIPFTSSVAVVTIAYLKIFFIFEHKFSVVRYNIVDYFY